MGKTNPMKKSLLSLTMLVLGTAIFVACKKSNDTPSAPSNTIEATVGTTGFVSSHTLSVLFDVSTNFDLLGSEIVSGDSVGFELQFPDTLVVNKIYPATAGGLVGTNISIDYYNFHTFAIYAPDDNNPVASISITAFDSTKHTIAGTFSGHFINTSLSTDSVVITNGKFNVTYVNQ